MPSSVGDTCNRRRSCNSLAVAAPPSPSIASVTRCTIPRSSRGESRVRHRPTRTRTRPSRRVAPVCTRSRSPRRARREMSPVANARSFRERLQRPREIDRCPRRRRAGLDSAPAPRTAEDTAPSSSQAPLRSCSPTGAPARDSSRSARRRRLRRIDRVLAREHLLDARRLSSSSNTNICSILATGSALTREYTRKWRRPLVGPPCPGRPRRPQWRRMTFSAATLVAPSPLDDRPQRLVGAARELANETGSAAFTVAQVAARAGLSLKSFYRCFRGKDDLLIALLAEESAVGAVLFEQLLARPSRPVAHVRARAVRARDAAGERGLRGRARPRAPALGRAPAAGDPRRARAAHRCHRVAHHHARPAARRADGVRRADGRLPRRRARSRRRRRRVRRLPLRFCMRGLEATKVPA